MGGPGGHWPPLLVKFWAIFVFSGNFSKCPYILLEKFDTAITSPKEKKKKKVITCLASRMVAYLGQR